MDRYRPKAATQGIIRMLRALIRTHRENRPLATLLDSSEDNSPGQTRVRWLQTLPLETHWNYLHVVQTLCAVPNASDA